MHDPCRRKLLRQALQLTTALVAVPRIAGAAASAASCVDPQSESLRGSLHYASASPVADQTCAGCGFYTASDIKSGCGNCVMMSGPVDATGHCDSWSPRS